MSELNPVLLTVFENTVPRSVRVCWLRNTHTMTITVTPTTCHHTETSLSNATSRIPNVFNRACRTSTTAYTAMVLVGLTG